MAFSLNLHTGYTGMVNFGVIFFVGIGAITVALLTAPEEMHGYGWDILPAAIVAIMISAIFGGIVAGFTTGFYLRLGGSVGGLDILGTVLKKRLEIPIGYLFNAINFIIIAGNAVLYDLETALFTGVYM